MKEVDLNSALSRSFGRAGFSFKIPDPLGGMGSQNPFDLFCVLSGKPLYIESKFKKGVYAFNFKSIEDHQWRNLLQIKSLLPEAYCLVVLGVWESRKFFHVLFFDITFLDSLRQKGEKSIKQKTLQSYIKNGKMLNINYHKEGTKRTLLVDGIDRLDEVIIND